jgi:poly-gamma-glutamate capsule biosynthesis protein CapA/YwtB (metallophosphatase superfamily)
MPRGGRQAGAARVAVAGALAALTAACSFGPLRRDHLEQSLPVVVEVLDERGVHVVDAQFTSGAVEERLTGGDGEIELDLSQPVAGVLSATGKLDEPLVLAPGDDRVTVVMFDRQSSSGLRVAYHFGGDTMLGRRYQTPGRDGTAVADDGDGARAVVDDLAPISSAADLTVVNVETVIGDLPADQALAAKRFLIASPPQIVDALRELGVDAVTLGNNHANDWGDTGVLSTLSALGPANIAVTGAGLSADEALRGVVLPVGDREVGLISATTVNGDFVNDQLPDADAEQPADLPSAEAWQYDARTFGFGAEGEPGFVASAPRRPGEAWRVFRALEPTLSVERAAALWSALTASTAYPELQDWVARRGHGGAAAYDRAAVAAEIERLRAEGADQVIVQFHAGFQFSERPSGALRRISRDAIDDGADMVVSHHPHVLQGLEWYRGRLIAYSLGNLLFDQDFLTTYPSAMLRVVVDRSGILEARLIPVLLVDYRPVPVAGLVAERILRLIDTRSALPGVSTRDESLDVGVVVTTDPAGGDAVPVSLALERNSGRVLAPSARAGNEITLSLAEGDATPLPACQSIDSTSIPIGVQYGVDLFGHGAFDDGTADGERGAPAQWVVDSRSEGEPLLVAGPSGAVTDDALQIIAEANLGATARFVSRVPIEQHRWFDDAGEPIDAPPTRTLEFDISRTLGADPSVDIDVYHVADEDPTSDPESSLLRELTVPVRIDAGDWVHQTIPLDADLFLPVDGLSADAAMVLFRAEPDILQTVRLDNVRVMEWRDAPGGEVPIWVEADALRSDRDQVVTVTATGCPSR